MTTDKRVAQRFADGPGGIVFVVDVLQGRSVKPYSAVQTEEEILLSPNSLFVVTQALEKSDDDGYYYVKMQQRHGKFVF